MLLLLALGCAVDCLAHPPRAGRATTCAVPGWEGRDVRVVLPEGWSGEPLPLVLVFHGGGGNARGANRTTCADGDDTDPSCITSIGDTRGFAVAFPDGTPKALGRFRSWNAGGGRDGWRCVGGVACEEGVDDVAYVHDVLDLIEATVAIDPTRVFATGMSNGAAMAHRLACDAPERFAAIAGVAGANQAQGWPGCAPTLPTPVLQVHGTDDPCWGWDGTVGPCLTDTPAEDRFVSVDETMAGWAERLGCVAEGSAQPPLDAVDDGTSVTRVAWEGCVAPLELVRVDGGGHTWPGGWSYLREARIGPVSLEVVGSELVWDFFAAAPPRD